MLLTGKQLKEGDQIPKWYGLAYKLYNQDTVVVLPIPINLIVRLLIYCYYSAVKAGYPNRWDRKLDIVWNAGIEAGRRERQYEIDMLKAEVRTCENLILRMKEHTGD